MFSLAFSSLSSLSGLGGNTSRKRPAEEECDLPDYAMGPPAGLSPLTHPQPKPKKARVIKEQRPRKPSPYKKWPWPLAHMWRKKQDHLEDWQNFNTNYAAQHSVSGAAETYENREGWTEVDWNEDAWLEQSLSRFDLDRGLDMRSQEDEDEEPQRRDSDLKDMYRFTGTEGLSDRCGRW
jgi:hypothetical protein